MQINDIYTFPRFKDLIQGQSRITPHQAAALVIIAVYSDVFDLSLEPKDWLEVVRDKMPELDVTETFLSTASRRRRWDDIWFREFYGEEFSIRLNSGKIRAWAHKVSFGFPFTADLVLTRKLLTSDCYSRPKSRQTTHERYRTLHAANLLMKFALQQNDMAWFNEVASHFCGEKLFGLMACSTDAVTDIPSRGFSVSYLTSPLIEWLSNGGDLRAVPTFMLPFLLSEMFARSLDVRPVLTLMVEQLPQFLGNKETEWLPFLVLPSLAAIALAVGDASAFEAVLAAADRLPADDTQVRAKEIADFLDTINKEIRFGGGSSRCSRILQKDSLHLPVLTRTLLSVCRRVVDGNASEIGETARLAAVFFKLRSIDELSQYRSRAMAVLDDPLKLAVDELVAMIRCAACVLEPFMSLCALVLHTKNTAQTVLRQYMSVMGALEHSRYKSYAKLTESYLSHPFQNSSFLDLRDANCYNPWQVAAAVYGWSRRTGGSGMDQAFIERAAKRLNELTRAGYAGIVHAAGGFWSALPTEAPVAEFQAAASVASGLTYALFTAPTRNENWPKMLSQLAKTFPTESRKKRAVTETTDMLDVRWGIMTPPYDRYYNSSALLKVCFGYVDQTKKRREFKSIEFGSVAQRKKIAASMSENDLALWDLISAEHERRGGEDYDDDIVAGIYPTSPVEILDALARADNVYVQTTNESWRGTKTKSDKDSQSLIWDTDYHTSRISHKKAHVVMSPIEVVADSSPGGGMILKLTHVLPKGRNPFILTLESPTRLVYSKITEAERKFERVIDTFGMNGQILLPPESLADTRRVLAGIAAHLPMRGTFAPTAADAFEHISAEPSFIFRLKFGGDVLEARQTVKVHPALEETVEPGVGKGERVVMLEGRAVVMTRDLANERARHAEILDAMRPFSDWEEEKGLWRVEGLETVLDVLDALHGLGDKVSLEWDGHGCRVVRPVNMASSLEATEGADHWFSVRGSFELDNGKVLSFIDLLSRLETARDGYVKLDDETYFKITKSLARRLEALGASGRVKGGVLSVPPAALPMLDRAFAGSGEMALPDAMRVQAEKVRKVCARSVVVPERLRCDLRSYQVDGYRWLSRLTACGFGVCLADDMGLGKTVQIIALLLERAGTGASLVVAPASLVGNWRNELYRFAPTLTPVVCGAEDSESRVKAAGAFDVVIASYGLTASRIEQFSSRSWNGIVLDEAQAIKNHLTQRAKSVRMLAGEFRVVATGTPVENRLSELWSLFDFLNPGLLSTRQWFLENHTCDGQAKPSLKKLVSPLILRRLKRDVLDDLPEKTEITLRIPLTDAERHAYEGARLRALDKLSTGGEDTSRISILAELTRLRRFCCHPSLVIPDFSDSSKLDALLELLENLRSGGHRALIFSQFTDYLAIVRRAVTEAGWTYRYLDGTTALKARDEEVAAFQRGEGDFFLISLKAGGMGLNLTAANYVILLDPWWNPAVENQAADRVYRIGQKQPVTVYRLIAEDTVEERVAELHRKKLKISDDLLSETGSVTVSEKELMGLFSSAAAAYEPVKGKK